MYCFMDNRFLLGIMPSSRLCHIRERSGRGNVEERTPEVVAFCTVCLFCQCSDHFHQQSGENSKLT